MKEIKRRILIISLTVIALSLCVGGTLAYFTASETARNVIVAGDISIELIETDEEGKTFVNVTNVMPSAEIAKSVSVKNISANPCWVRISVEKAILLSKEKQGTADLSLIHINYNTDEWTEKDGFFYYQSKLDPGKSTEPLFTKVSFDPSMDNLYQGSTASITVSAGAVQCVNNGDSVLEAKGWPAK